MQVVFLSRARTDLLRLRNFLEPHGQALANQIYDRLFEAAISLEEMPKRGRPAARPPYRELVVPFGNSAYVIRYRVDQSRDRVVIVRLWHARERR